MAHDFAKKRQSEKAGPHKKHASSATRPQGAAGSHWSWFFTGLLSGLFLAFIGFLSVFDPPPSATGESATAMETGVESEADPAGGNFDFYEYLPEAEVLVDVVPVEIRQSEPPPEDNAQYLLQAGSFQNEADAENRRSKVLLNDFEATVVPGVVSGQTWHRVQVGPFNTRGAAEDARQTLASNGIDTIVLKKRL